PYTALFRSSRWGHQRIGGSGDGGRPGLHQLPQYPGERAHPPGVRLAVMITSSSFVPELEQQGIRFVTHPGPPGPGKNGYRFSGATSSTLSIVSSTQHPKEAWTFLRWLVYEKGLEFAEERGGIPYLIEGLQSGKYRAQPWEAFATSILTYQPRNNYIYGVSEADWLPAFQAAWDAAIRGEGDARVM